MVYINARYENDIKNFNFMLSITLTSISDDEYSYKVKYQISSQDSKKGIYGSLSDTFKKIKDNNGEIQLDSVASDLIKIVILDILQELRNGEDYVVDKIKYDTVSQLLTDNFVTCLGYDGCFIDTDKLHRTQYIPTSIASKIINKNVISILRDGKVTILNIIENDILTVLHFNNLIDMDRLDEPNYVKEYFEEILDNPKIIYKKYYAENIELLPEWIKDN